MIPKGLIERDEAERISLGTRPMIVVFDGECGFCTWFLDVVMRLRKPDDAVLAPYQWLGEDALGQFGTSKYRCTREVHVLFGDGAHLSGARAVNALCRTVPMVGSAIGVLSQSRRLLEIEQRLYEWIAGNREGVSSILGTAKYALLESTRTEEHGPPSDRFMHEDESEAR